ncbi:MAG: carboxymuconolactone decarboxylase family protein [Gemmatimonas sp.]
MSRAASHVRLDYAEFRKRAPQVADALTALSKTARENGIEPDLVELIKIRASQINGCAFCLQYHLNEARRLGVAPEKLDLVATWREAGIYSAREQAALAWTEALTEVSRNGAPEDVYEEVVARFGDTQALFLTVAVATINTWNRIGVAFTFAPPIPKPAAARAAG